MGKTHTCLLQGLQQFGHMFCRMGKIEDAHRIRPMPVSKELQPVCSIHDRAHLLGLLHFAPSHLHFCEIEKGRGLREPGKIREMIHMDLWLASSSELLF